MKRIMALLMVSFLFTPVAQAEELTNDVYCLAQNMYFEARGEEPAGIVAVGNVVLNRVQNKHFPNTICKVVKQGGERRNRCQFSWRCDGRSDKIRDKQAWKVMIFIAKKLLNGSIADNTNGALFYHTKNVNPYWNTNMTPKMQLGSHIFY